MYFPAFWSRWKLPRWSSQQVEDILHVDIFKASLSEDDGLPTIRSLTYEPSTSATSDGFMSPLLTPTSQSNNLDFHLELPRFTSLVDDLTDLLQPVHMEEHSLPSFNLIGKSIRDRRDDLIEELLDHVDQLRHKVRSLGDDNSRLRRQLTDSRPHDAAITNPRKHLSDKAGGTPAPLRPHMFRKNSSSLEDEHNSQGDCDSAYSYYNNPDYFPYTSSPTPSSPVSPSSVRLRARTESILPADSFMPSGYQKRRRYYSLPTPKQCREYAESLKDGPKLELGPHLRRLINLRCSVSSERPILDKSLIRDAPSVNKDLTSSPEVSPSTWSLRSSGKGSIRRPQPRIQLSALEPIFRCFSCSQRFGHCAYADCIWIGDRYINFGYFEMVYFHAAYGLWGPANLVTEYYNSLAQPVDENVLEAENRPSVEDVEDEVEVNTVFPEVTPLSSVHLLEASRRENVQSFVAANEHAVSDAHRRRERHIALLDSIIEEEELDDEPLAHPSSPVTTGIHHPKPVRVSEMAARQVALAVIPDQEIDSSCESTTTTSRSCPPLTDDSFSSACSQEQGSLVTFEDFEDIDFVSSSQGSESSLGYNPLAASTQVNTVAFPVTHPLTERLNVWELSPVIACN